MTAISRNLEIEHEWWESSKSYDHVVDWSLNVPGLFGYYRIVNQITWHSKLNTRT
jgi:hypothetical protein